MRMLLLILLPVFLTPVHWVRDEAEIQAGRNEPIESRIDDAIAFAGAAMSNAAEKQPPADVDSKPRRAVSTVYAAWPFDAVEARRRQEETANALDQPIEAANSLGMKFRLIPAGEFMMGSLEDEEGRGTDESPIHRVRITKPFYLGTYEVTVGQFRQFVKATGYKTDAEKDGKGGWGYTGDDKRPFKRDPQYTWRNTGFSQNADHPVVNVSWNDSVAFCEWLSRKEGRTYGLPTEGQWEYACRAGTRTRYYHGDAAKGLAGVGNTSDAAANEKFSEWMKISAVDREKMGTADYRDGYVFTVPVGRFRANGFGLYDMHGNVWEWCADWDKADYYGESPTDDPTGPADGSSRIRRGGSWLHSARYSRSATRRRYPPDGRNSPIGFRVVRTVSGP